MIQRLSHTNVYVLNQDEALTFYRDKLGFEVKMDMTLEGGFRWLTVSPPGQADLQLILSEISEGPMFDADKVAKMTELVKAGAFGIGVFQTADCKATHDELSAKGVAFSQPPTERFYGIEAIGSDNSGNWFSLTQPQN